MDNNSNQQNKLNLPNILTFVRIILIPVLVFTYYSSFSYHYLVTAIIFASASLTDWLDGFLARRWGQETRFGAFCDPLADKLIVIVALVLLLGEYNSLWITVPSLVIISREVIISGLREWMAEHGLSSAVSVVYSAKIKTTMQMIAIIILLSQQPDASLLIAQFGILLLIIAAGLSVWTMAIYFCNSWHQLD